MCQGCNVMNRKFWRNKTPASRRWKECSWLFDVRAKFRQRIREIWAARRTQDNSRVCLASRHSFKCPCSSLRGFISSRMLAENAEKCDNVSIAKQGSTKAEATWAMFSVNVKKSFSRYEKRQILLRFVDSFVKKKKYFCVSLTRLQKAAKMH